MSDTPATPEPQPPAASDLQPIVVVGYFLFSLLAQTESRPGSTLSLPIRGSSGEPFSE